MILDSIVELATKRHKAAQKLNAWRACVTPGWLHLPEEANTAGRTVIILNSFVLLVPFRGPSTAAFTGHESGRDSLRAWFDQVRRRL